uniref:O-methyltransferase dimerisation domain-containing protein n=1 Tax=Gossypium raimondii TaxID=29730 RepID=A0A0D2RQ30_GOSRA|nr:hypothetical protein B456_005G203200 [Gossypium raimondii]
MALKSAEELRIADIIHPNGGAATLSQIASCINDSLTSLDITTRARIMRLLVRRKIFTIRPPSDGGDPLNLDFNKLFNDGLACTSKFITSAILSSYKQWFNSIGSLVDVSHIGGDMFHAIPITDAIIMKYLSKSIISRTTTITEDGSGVFDDIGFVMDLVMFAHINAKERTEAEWKKILELGGFSHYKIINIPALVSIIEAYPDA